MAFLHIHAIEYVYPGTQGTYLYVPRYVCMYTCYTVYVICEPTTRYVPMQDLCLLVLSPLINVRSSSGIYCKVLALFPGSPPTQEPGNEAIMGYVVKT